MNQAEYTNHVRKDHKLWRIEVWGTKEKWYSPSDKWEAKIFSSLREGNDFCSNSTQFAISR